MVSQGQTTGRVYYISDDSHQKKIDAIHFVESSRLNSACVDIPVKTSDVKPGQAQESSGEDTGGNAHRVELPVDGNLELPVDLQG